MPITFATAGSRMLEHNLNCRSHFEKDLMSRRLSRLYGWFSLPDRMWHNPAHNNTCARSGTGRLAPYVKSEPTQTSYQICPNRRANCDSSAKRLWTICDMRPVTEAYRNDHLSNSSHTCRVMRETNIKQIAEA